MATPNYDINYNDKRFTEVEADKKAALSEVEKTYGGMISKSDKYYQAQIDASKDWAETQKKNQQQQTDFAIEQIEQQKAQAKQDYTKEQSGAYVDWQKQSNQYGANAERMAAQGMQNTGYSESSQVSMYNTYQNRIATAREAFVRATLNYDNAIKDAQLQNNSKLAEIAYQALQTQLELSLQGFQYKNQLIIDKANKKTELENTYYQRYQDVLDQINQENALAEEVRQYNENLAEEKRQYDSTLAEQKRQHEETLAEQRRQHNQEMAYKQDALKFEKTKYYDSKASSSSSGGSSGGSSSIKKSKSSGSSSSSKKGAKSAGKDSSSIRTSKSSKTTSKSTKSSSPTVDMGSVLSLGYGPISASKLDSLVRSGKVVETQKNGKLTYKKAYVRKIGL